MSLAETSRTIERFIFGALLGTLGGVLACRLVLIGAELDFLWLVAIWAVGTWTGGFLAYLRTGESQRAVDSLQALAWKFRQVCLGSCYLRQLWMGGPNPHQGYAREQSV